MARRSLAEVASWVGQKVEKDLWVLRFEQDSRAVQPGDLFFALKGERSDGHDFLREVASQGACAAVVAKGYTGGNYGMELIRVDDVLEGLQMMARQCFATNTSPVIAVTGSVGKTTTKEFIARLLEEKYRVAKTPGSINSQVGLPLFILNGSGDAEVYVLEMGMNHPGEIRRLVQIAPPDIAVVTKIALAHAAFFPNGLSDIAQAKAEIFSSPKTSLGILGEQAAGFSVIHEAGSCRKLTYGPTGDYSLVHKEGQYQIIGREDVSPRFSLPFNASHLCEDFLGAAVVARAAELSWEQIIAGASQLTMAKNRFQAIERNGIVFLNDSYNASVVSMTAALMNLPSPKQGGKVIGVLGEMRELGDFSNECHHKVGEVALPRVEHLLCLGKGCQPMVDLFQAQGKLVELFSDLHELKKRVFEIASAGDVVLLKGANSLQLWKVLD